MATRRLLLRGLPHGLPISLYTLPAGRWTRYGSQQVIGYGVGGAGASENCNSSGGGRVGSTTYIFCGNGYSDGGRITLYTSGDGFNFRKSGVAIRADALPGMTRTGNFTLYPEAVDGVYHALVEGYFTDTGIWETFHATSTDLTAWTPDILTGRLTSMQVVPGGMYGGAHLTRRGNQWHAWYHYADRGALGGRLRHRVGPDLYRSRRSV